MWPNPSAVCMSIDYTLTLCACSTGSAPGTQPTVPCCCTLHSGATNLFQSCCISHQYNCTYCVAHVNGSSLPRLCTRYVQNTSCLHQGFCTLVLFISNRYSFLTSVDSITFFLTHRHRRNADDWTWAQQGSIRKRERGERSWQKDRRWQWEGLRTDHGCGK